MQTGKISRTHQKRPANATMARDAGNSVSSPQHYPLLQIFSGFRVSWVVSEVVDASRIDLACASELSLFPLFF